MTKRRPVYSDGYFKVSRRLLSSSLWAENSDVLRVFLVLLELAQDPRGPQDGTVVIARPILAGKALLTHDKLDECLAVLLSPDGSSRSPEFEGRRIEELPNGFRILNHSRYHDEARDRLLRRARERAGRHGGEISGKVRARNALARSKIEANAKQNEAHEHEHEHEHNRTEERRPAANPLIAGRRPDLERECLVLVGRMAELTREDPLDVMARASGYDGAQRTKLNPATMTDDRLANTVRDLRADVAAEEKKLARIATR